MRSSFLIIMTCALLAGLACYEPPPVEEPVPQWYWNNGPTSDNLYDLTATAENELWACGVTAGDQGEVFSCAGYFWGTETLPMTPPPLYTIDAVEDGAVWAAGAGDVFIYRVGGDWKTWAHPAPGKNIYCLRMIDDINGWAVGEGGLIFKFDGLAWNAVASPTTATLRRIQILAPNNIWAVGDAGTVLHYDGADWETVTFAPTVDLYDLNFFSSTDGWVVGKSSSAYHWNGTAWRRAELPNATMNYRCCAFATVSKGWAGGDQMHLARYDGVEWAFEGNMPSGTWSLNAIHFVSPNEGWAVGPAGAILHYH